MVNGIVVRHGNGNYSIDKQHPLYVETLRKFDLKCANEKAKGEIKEFVQARCGGKEHLALRHLWVIYIKCLIL